MSHAYTRQPPPPLSPGDAPAKINKPLGSARTRVALVVSPPPPPPRLSFTRALHKSPHPLAYPTAAAGKFPPPAPRDRCATPARTCARTQSRAFARAVKPLGRRHRRPRPHHLADKRRVTAHAFASRQGEVAGWQSGRGRREAAVGAREFRA